MRINFYFWLPAVSLLISACVEPYQPSVTENNPEHLVVNASVDASGSATISLTYTTNITSTEPPFKSEDAQVEIVAEDGERQVISETEPGLYTSTTLLIIPNKKYHLSIRTIDGTEYLSDLVEALTTPAIDSISFIVRSDGVDVNLNTHDASNSNKYFRWTFVETWKYYSTYYSRYRIVEGEPILRSAEEDVYTCYQTQKVQRIIVGSTNGLKESTVSNFTLTTIPPGSAKIVFAYGILVQQQSISEQAYNYWLNLQKSTENVGGLFDPLPSEVMGNIYCVSNPNKKALGNFSISTIEEDHRMLNPEHLPDNFIVYPRNVCLVDSVLFEEEDPLVSSENAIDIIYPMGPPGDPIGYTVTTKSCMDCRVYGGVTTKPAFWD